MSYFITNPSFWKLIVYYAIFVLTFRMLIVFIYTFTSYPSVNYFIKRTIIGFIYSVMLWFCLVFAVLIFLDALNIILNLIF